MAIFRVQEYEFYYLQSRYYDPEVGRFLNADILASTGQGILGNNMFAYCNNNPILFLDPEGLCLEVGALLTWFDCGNHNCPTSSLCQPSRYSGGYNNPKNNYHINSEPYWENLAKTQEVSISSPLSFYKGVPVIYIPGDVSFSFGIIFMGKDGGDNLLKHEYGHVVQLSRLGFWNYCQYVAVPSITVFWASKSVKWLDTSYFSLPWEYQADQLGKASHSYSPWAEAVSSKYWTFVAIYELLKLCV